MKLLLITALFFCISLNGYSNDMDVFGAFTRQTKTAEKETQLSDDAKPQKSKISGIVTGKAKSLLKQIQFYSDGKSEMAKVDPETLTFTTEIEFKEPMFVGINSGGKEFNYVYVMPGEDFKLTIEKNNLYFAKITIHNDKISKLNAPLIQFYKTFTDNDISIQLSNWHEELFDRPWLVEEAIENARKIINENEKFITKNAPELIEDFELFASSFISFTRIDNFSLGEIDTLLDEVKTFNPSISTMTIPFYKSFLIDLSNAYAAGKLEMYGLSFDILKNGHVSKLIAAEALVENVKNQDVIDYLFYDKINTETLINGLKNRTYVDYLLDNSGEKLRGFFSKRYNDLLENLAKGDGKQNRLKALDFEFVDADGKVYRLEDFKGRLIFIDFWATWCAPCKAQAPHFEALKEFYKGKAIDFVKVSLDNNKNAWLKAEAADEHEGYSLYAEGAFKNPFPVHYGINSIPRFMLIDAEGRMISDNMTKPQNKNEVIAMVDAELYESEVADIVNKHLAAVGVEKIKEGAGYNIKAIRSIFGLNIEIDLAYSYPEKLKYSVTPQEDTLFALSLGEDFFKQSYIIMDEDTLSGNLKKQYEFAEEWYAKSFGLEIFILNDLEKIPFKFADENSANEENQYVLETVYAEKTLRFLINKESFMLEKVIQVSKVKPRGGGGVFETSHTYSDFKNVDGVMIPFSSNINNMIEFKVSDANIEPIDDSYFKH